MIAMIEFENGNCRIAVPCDAPGVIDLIAGAYNAEVYRIGRDGDEAVRLHEEQIFMRDGLFAAARICARLAQSGESLRELESRLPRFSISSREISLSGDRGLVMRALAESCVGNAIELYEGIRTRTQRGWVHISPLISRSALRITGESANAETADELCAVFERRARKIDNECSK
jgi:mannose-1-phosphate guanylyltransferase/phosphomannomutase